jgi:hypothetical protein
MPRIHVPENKSPQPSCGFLTLIDAADADQQVNLLMKRLRGSRELVTLRTLKIAYGSIEDAGAELRSDLRLH